ncbi:hypothetical protein AcW1_002210 [Taiwanofungus camphoratus]|nr:hypothetical protein AcV5_010204 [Antrodia cinnamomea]KAI0944528.1 hypothetical protein AcW1_002210 [Antrodia cinnamomea]KAI0946188.1 hypothetical protein AcV7_010225 [Antrodia cinnamomea]
MLARPLTGIEHLVIDHVRWQGTMMQTNFFWLLSEFDSITELSLKNADFRSLKDFGRLICPFANLYMLTVAELKWSSSVISPSLTLRRSAFRINLTSLCIDSGDTASVVDIIDWFLAVMPCGSLHSFEAERGTVHFTDLQIFKFGQLRVAAGSSLCHISVHFSTGTLVQRRSRGDRHVRALFSLQNSVEREIGTLVQIVSRC